MSKGVWLSISGRAKNARNIPVHIRQKHSTSKLEYRIKQLTKADKLRIIADESCFAKMFGEENAKIYIREDVRKYVI